MVNVNKLLGLITEAGYKRTEFAEKIGMSYQAWSRRLREDNGFTQSEIAKIADVLCLNGDQIVDIFFASKVS